MTTPSADSVRDCACDCGCEPDGEWHFQELRCACVGLGCPCVTDQPRYGRCEVCDRVVTANEDRHLRADIDFVEHRGHLIRRVQIDSSGAES